MAQTAKNPPAVWETWVWSLGWDDPLKEGMSTHSCILAWRIPVNRGAWWATDQGVAKSRTQLSGLAQHNTGDPYSHPTARIYESTSFLSSLHAILLQGERGVVSPTIALSEAFRLSLSFYYFKGWCNQTSWEVFVGKYLAVALLRGIRLTPSVFFISLQILDT